MTFEDMQKVSMLGRLRSIREAMDNISLADTDLNDEMFQAKRQLSRVLDKHWDEVNRMLNFKEESKNAT